MTREECEKEAKENRNLAERAYREGKKEMGDEAIERAIEWDRNANSWLHRWFGL